MKGQARLEGASPRWGSRSEKKRSFEKRAKGESKFISGESNFALPHFFNALALSLFSLAFPATSSQFLARMNSN